MLTPLPAVIPTEAISHIIVEYIFKVKETRLAYILLMITYFQDIKRIVDVHVNGSLKYKPSRGAWGALLYIMSQDVPPNAWVLAISRREMSIYFTDVFLLYHWILIEKKNMKKSAKIRQKIFMPRFVLMLKRM